MASAKFQTRDSLLPKSCSGDRDKLIRGQEIEFLPTYVEKSAMTIYDAKNINNWSHKRFVSGTTPQGLKINVVIEGILCYFDVFLGETEEAAKAEIPKLRSLINNLLLKDSFLTGRNAQKSIKAMREIMLQKGREFKYRQSEAYFGRCRFTKMAVREKVINLLEQEKTYRLFNDINGPKYYAQSAYTYDLDFGNWVSIKNYTLANAPGARMRFEGTQGPTIFVHYSDFVRAPKALRTENSICLCWDVETYSADGRLPSDSRPEDKLIMIGCTVSTVSSIEKNLKICFCSHETEPDPDFVSVHCADEEQMFLCFLSLCAAFRVDFLLAFNNTCYDNHWLLQRGKKYSSVKRFLCSRVLSWNTRRIYKQLFSSQGSTLDAEIADKSWEYGTKNASIKIAADNTVRGLLVRWSGLVDLDLRMMLLGFNNTVEFSNLNYFLKKNNLSSKDNLEISKLFSMYGRILKNKKTDQDRKDMRTIAHYCVFDCVRTAELLIKTRCLPDYRNLASIGFSDLHDAIYRGTSFRVENKVFHEMLKRKLFCSNRAHYDQPKKKSASYSGGFVMDPVTGLIKPKLTIMQRIDIGQAQVMGQTSKMIHKIFDQTDYTDWFDTTEEDLEKYYALVRKHGCFVPNVNEIDDLKDLPNCVKAFFSEPQKYPVGALDFASLYPSLIMTYNLSHEKIEKCSKKKIGDYFKSKPNNGLFAYEMDLNKQTHIAHVDRHSNSLETYGVFPFILRELFDSRKKMKLKKKNLKRELEKLTSDGAPKDQIDQVHADFYYFDSLQKTLKVFMNCFYGQTGNPFSPVHCLEIASGTTSLGRQALKYAIDRVRAHKCKVYYGDTDSVYFSCNPQIFSEIDSKYYSGQISVVDYAEQAIALTFTEIRRLNGLINADLVEYSNCDRLVMDYEEVLYPAMFLCKKKYFGREHVSRANFPLSTDSLAKNQESLFVKGLNFKKRGSCKFTKDLLLRLLLTTIDLSTTDSIENSIANKLHEIRTGKGLLLESFQLSDKYRPSKNNVRVNEFAERISNSIVLQPSERFKYYFVRRHQWTYSEKGTKTMIRSSERMAHVSQVKDISEIDVNHYLVHRVISQYANLIGYNPHILNSIPGWSELSAPQLTAKATASAVKVLTKEIDHLWPLYANQSFAYAHIYSRVLKGIKSCLPVLPKPLTFAFLTKDPEKQIAQLLRNKLTKQQSSIDSLVRTDLETIAPIQYFTDNLQEKCFAEDLIAVVKAKPKQFQVLSKELKEKLKEMISTYKQKSIDQFKQQFQESKLASISVQLNETISKEVKKMQKKSDQFLDRTAVSFDEDQIVQKIDQIELGDFGSFDLEIDMDSVSGLIDQMVVQANETYDVQGCQTALSFISEMAKLYSRKPLKVQRNKITFYH